MAHARSAMTIAGIARKLGQWPPPAIRQIACVQSRRSPQYPNLMAERILDKPVTAVWGPAPGAGPGSLALPAHLLRCSLRHAVGFLGGRAQWFALASPGRR